MKIRIETVVNVTEDDREALGHALQLGRPARHSEIQHWFQDRIEALAIANALPPLLRAYYSDKAEQYKAKAATGA
jgi:hypothetical protein